jgi:hypothetical protein
MNLELMLKVRQQFTEKPWVCDMGHFSSIDAAFNEDHPEPTCGTTGCIGGWAVMIDRGVELSNFKINEYIAKEALGLTELEAMQLFYMHEPSVTQRCCRRYSEWDGTYIYADLSVELSQHPEGSPAYAAVIVKAIDRCIERNYKPVCGAPPVEKEPEENPADLPVQLPEPIPEEVPEFEEDDVAVLV